jgi:ABC-type antimicrobial peptide transport system permease subunit
VGRSDPEDYRITGWNSQPDGVYAYAGAHLKPGSQVKVTFRDGTSRILTVIGAYEINAHALNLASPTGLLMSAGAFTSVARPDSITYFARFAPNRLSQASAALATSLPQATVVNLVDYAARFMQSYRSLYFLPIILAGLALLAGILLVANAVSLAMLDRRYEIGVLKAIGYSRRQVLTIFAVEFGLVGLLATAAGVLFIQFLLAMLALSNRLSATLLLLSLPSLALVFLCGVGLTLLTVLWVAWAPTRVSPMVTFSSP